MPLKLPGVKRFGIVTKMVGTFLIVIIPIYVISLMVNQTGVNVVKNEVSNLAEQRSYYILSSIEAEINRIYNLQLAFLNDSDLQDLSIRPDSLRMYERTKAINDLLSKLSILASSSKYIEDAFVIVPKTQKRISSKNKYEDLNIHELNTLSKASNKQMGLVYWNNRLFIVLGYPITTRSQYLLVTELSLKSIGKDLDISDGAVNTIAYISDQKNNILSVSRSFNGNKSEIQEFENKKENQTIIYKGKHFVFFDLESKLLKWKLVTLFRQDEILKPLNPFKNWYWLITFFSLIVILVVSFMFYRVIHRPLKMMVGAFGKVEKGQLDIHITHNNDDEFKYLYGQFNQMVDKLRVLLREVYEKTIYSQKAELKQLQSQINPHFLYNSLYNIYRMAQDEDYEGVSALAKHLGDYFKFITQNKSDLVSLEQEINHAKLYASIQHIRFSNRISFNFEISGTMDSWEVPRLIIQPIIENSIVHGLKDIYQDGSIHVNAIAESKRLTVEVSDNGKGMSAEELLDWKKKLETADQIEDHHALWNIHKRLAIYYGNGSGIELESSSLGGLTVRIRIEAKGEYVHE